MTHQRSDRGPVTAADLAAPRPVGIALRHRATSIVDTELRRLEKRLQDADEAVRAEAEDTVHRVVDALLRAPLAHLDSLPATPAGHASLRTMSALLDLGTDHDQG